MPELPDIDVYVVVLSHKLRSQTLVAIRLGQPRPVCKRPVQRIRYKSNETNYRARCQSDSRILKDRSLSRLLKQGWPKTLDEL